MFSKDDEGCITAEELKFVLTHLPGKVGIGKEKKGFQLWSDSLVLYIKV